jgi:transcriptional regulator with XRE-family HTH domain
VDNRTEVREFLVSRRAKITPEQAGLPAGTNRRVPGLRRTEVAALAGVSIEYYSKLERGALAGVSASVLDAIARALQLDDAERAHLFDLARAADGSSALLRPRRRSSKQCTPHRSLQWTLDAVTEGPAFVRNGRMDLLAANRLARAFYAQVYADPQRPPNLARFTFLDDNAHDFYPDWTPPPISASPSCALRPAATPATRTSTTSSASCPPAAPSSVPAGAPTTSATTAPARRPSTITSSATSPSPTKAWRWPPNPA